MIVLDLGLRTSLRPMGLVYFHGADLASVCAVRLTLGRWSTEEQVDTAAQELHQAVSALSKKVSPRP